MTEKDIKNDLQISTETTNDLWFSSVVYKIGAAVSFIVFLIFFFIWLSSHIGDTMLTPGTEPLVIIICAGLFFLTIFLLFRGILRGKKLNKTVEQAAAKAEERITALTRQVEEGTWELPYYSLYEFFKKCRDSKITDLNNEFNMSKARLFAEDLIKKAAPDVEFSKFDKYLTKEGLESFLAKGKSIDDEVKATELVEMRKPRDAKLNDSEKYVIDRLAKLAQLFGSEKRVAMLSDLVEAYSKNIDALNKGEDTFNKLRMHNERYARASSGDWAIMGGIADAIAGPAAGVMVASDIRERNARENAALAQQSKDYLWASMTFSEKRRAAEKEREKTLKELNEAKLKVVLSKPTKEEIWENIDIGEAVVNKNEQGLLNISLPLTLKKQFALDAPQNAKLVVDGVITAEVWFENIFLDTVYLPLPIFGLPCDPKKEVTADGLCKRFIKQKGKYTVKILDTPNLWIMEA